MKRKLAPLKLRSETLLKRIFGGASASAKNCFLIGFLIFGLVACERKESSSATTSQDPQQVQLREGQARPKVGQKAPDFVLPDLNGTRFRLSDFEGSLVFVNFWATWCPPCIYEMPSMEMLNQRFRTRGFQMLAVSVDDNVSIVQNFLSRLSPRPSFLILHDPGKLVTEFYYGTEKFPESYLIGPDGVLLKKYEGAFEWTNPAVFSEIEAYLDQFSL
jgi:peroxiredoxin